MQVADIVLEGGESVAAGWGLLPLDVEMLQGIGAKSSFHLHFDVGVSVGWDDSLRGISLCIRYHLTLHNATVRELAGPAWHSGSGSAVGGNWLL